MLLPREEHIKAGVVALEVLHVVINIICTATWIAVTYFSFQWMLRLRLIGTTASSVNIKMWIIWLPIVLFCVSSAVRYLIQIFKSVFQRKAKETEGGEAA